MRQLMENHRGELTPEIFMNEILQDHRGYPDSICRHCDLTGPIGEQFDTCLLYTSMNGFNTPPGSSSKISSARIGGQIDNTGFPAKKADDNLV